MEDRDDVAAALKDVRLALTDEEGAPPVSGLAVAQVMMITTSPIASLLIAVQSRQRSSTVTLHY